MVEEHVRGVADQRLGEWPYTIVMHDEDLMLLGAFLQDLGSAVDKTPVGIACTQAEITFATTEQGWVMPRAAFTDAAKAMLKRLLFSEQGSPAFCARSARQLVDSFDDWFGFDESKAILPNVIHNMSSLEYTTGRPVAQGLTALKDALDCATIAPMLALEAGAYYREVAMPLAIHEATRNNDWTGPNWSLKYDFLLFKVAAHYAHDPTITKWFQQGENPLTQFGAACGGLRAMEASAFLMWMVCGEDEVLLSAKHPDWAARLPEAPQLVKATYVDKNLPSFRMGLIRLYDTLKRARRGSTLYGRRAPWGLSPQELLYFTIMGSVRDIIQVANASLLRLGSDAHWLDEDTHQPWNRATIRGHHQGEETDMEWEAKVTELAKLNDPLGIISLEPKVSFA